MHHRRPPVTTDRRARRGGVAVVLALLLSTLGIAIGAAPASALSTFSVTVVPQQPLIAGSEADLTVFIKNTGPDPADDVFTSIHLLDAGITFVSGEPCVAPNTCAVLPFGTIDPGETYPVTIRVHADPAYVLEKGGGGPSATVRLGVDVDYDLGFQSTIQEISVGERADLRVNKYVSPPQAFAGDDVQYQIDVDNLGPSVAREVTIQDTLFALAGGADPTFSISQCTYSTAQGGGIITQSDCVAGPIVTAVLGNDLGTFGTDRLDPVSLVENPPDPPVVHGRLRAAFRLTAYDAVSFTNEVRVLSATADPDTTNNLAVAPHSFEAAADLGVALNPSTATPVAGDTVDLEVVVTNAGPSRAHGVVAELELPWGLEYVSSTSSDGTCLGGSPGVPDDPVVCLFGSIPAAVAPNPPETAAATITVRVRADVAPGTVLRPQAWVRSDVVDRNNTNDGVEEALTVQPPDLLFNPVTPARQFDTRSGIGGVPVAKVPGGTALEFTVTGVNGIPAGVAAVSLNVTIANPESDGYATVYPCATPPAAASNLNFITDQTVANAVVAPVDAAGKVCFFTTATTNIISDVSGWFAPASGYTSFTPVREFDTRFGTGGVPVGKLAGGSTLTFKVTGVNGVPASGVSAVALNVTVAEPAGDGLINVFPCGAQPLTSSLNYVVDQTVPNLVLAPVSPQGTVCFFTTTETHLLADVSGYFESGSDHHALNPTRVFDTRNGLGNVWWGWLPPGGSVEVDITGRNGVPTSGVGSVILNVTTTGAHGEGYVTVYPCGDLPLTSNVNYLPGRNIPNAVIAPVSSDGRVCFYSPIATDLVVDVSGWFAGVGV